MKDTHTVSTPAPTAFSRVQNEMVYPDGIENHSWNAARCLILNRILGRFLPREAKLLDVGCGRGTEVSFLLEKGWDCSGCDISGVAPTNPEIADRLYSSTASFDLPDEFKSKIDCLLFLDVLDHIEDPVKFIGRHLESFCNVRYLLITVPARMELWSNYDDFCAHYKRYDLRTLSSMLEHFAVQDVSGGYFFHTLYLPFLLTKLLGRKRSVQVSAPSGASIYCHRLLAKYFEVEFCLLPKSLPGTSLYALVALKK